VTLTGPRQSGKSTLCRACFPNLGYANLEAPDVREFAKSDPRGFLRQFSRGAVLDEVQRAPELASYLQVIVDEDPTPGRWVLTGSQNFALIESVSQSLAGRSAVLHLLPLTHNEVRRFGARPTTLDDALVTGGYPRIYDGGIPASEWLSAYVATYVERDVRTIANVGDLALFQRFLGLCAGRTGQLLNFSSLASDCGVSQPTARAWLSILEASFILFRVMPWSGNIGKRLTKMPKLHFYDTGLACWLLGIRSAEQLATHPLRGAIFETWVVSEVVKHRANAGERAGVWFYREQRGAEADLLVEHAGGFTVVEVKAGQTIGGDSLARARAIGAGLDGVRSRAMVVYGGDAAQERSDGSIVPWSMVGDRPWSG
jgi:predicted AAA+ superfamily ATPase